MRKKRLKKTSPRSWNRILDHTEGFLIIVSLIVAPWAFATVHPPAIYALNLIGYSLGIFATLKYISTKAAVTKPSQYSSITNRSRPNSVLSFHLGLTILIIAYILVAATNWRAFFDADTLQFTYNSDYLKWLPHSMNAKQTWPILSVFCALACFYWGTLSWLATPSNIENQVDSSISRHNEENYRLPRKCRRILYTLSLSGGIMALVAILQKLSGTNQLLWIYEPVFAKSSTVHFGPFAYRGNAATYFNVIWPLTLFTFLSERSSRLKMNDIHRTGSEAHIALLPILVLSFVSPTLSGSRAGLLITLCLASFLIFLAASRAKSLPRLLFRSTLAVVIASGVVFMTGQHSSFKRIRETLSAGMETKKETRLDIYQNFPAMYSDAGLWGTGPGTFSSIYLPYRKPTLQVRGWLPEDMHRNNRTATWVAWAHCDIAEFLITFGPFGTAMLLIWLFLALSKKIVGSALRHLSEFRYIVMFAVFGFCLHSMIDFPFQVYSLCHLFVIILALYPNLTLQQHLAAKARSRN